MNAAKVSLLPLVLEILSHYYHRQFILLVIFYLYALDVRGSRTFTVWVPTWTWIYFRTLHAFICIRFTLLRLHLVHTI